MKKSTIKQINQDMKLRDSATRVRKLKIKSAGKNFSQAPHTNFAEEIYQSQKTDKFLDIIFWTGCAILAVLAITLIIVNIW